MALELRVKVRVRVRVRVRVGVRVRVRVGVRVGVRLRVSPPALKPNNPNLNQVGLTTAISAWE